MNTLVVKPKKKKRKPAYKILDSLPDYVQTNTEILFREFIDTVAAKILPESTLPELKTPITLALLCELSEKLAEHLSDENKKGESALLA